MHHPTERMHAQEEIETEQRKGVEKREVRNGQKIWREKDKILHALFIDIGFD